VPKPYLQSVESVLDAEGTTVDDGLDGDEARRRLEQHGPNRLRTSRARPVWRILIDQFESLVVLLLLGAAAAALLLDRML
jgi:Ca2+-transporting ATPase